MCCREWSLLSSWFELLFHCADLTGCPVVTEHVVLHQVYPKYVYTFQTQLEDLLEGSISPVALLLHCAMPILIHAAWPQDREKIDFSSFDSICREKVASITVGIPYLLRGTDMGGATPTGQAAQEADPRGGRYAPLSPHPPTPTHCSIQLCNRALCCALCAMSCVLILCCALMLCCASCRRGSVERAGDGAEPRDAGVLRAEDPAPPPHEREVPLAALAPRLPLWRRPRPARRHDHPRVTSPSLCVC